MDLNEMISRLEARFGGRLGHMAFQIAQLSAIGQRADVTFFHRKPLINVKVDPQIANALNYGVGSQRFAEMLSDIKFSDGSRAGIGGIWTINAMPNAGFTEEDLAAVDMSEADEPSGPNGETLRKMIRETYHCENQQEEEFYIRRWIAS